MDELIKFEAGKTYIMSLLGTKTNNYFQVIKRTEKTLTVINRSWQNEIKTLKIFVLRGIEFVKPAGNYNGSSILKADKDLVTISVIDVQRALRDVLKMLKTSDLQDTEFSINAALDKCKRLSRLEFEEKHARYK